MAGSGIWEAAETGIEEVVCDGEAGVENSAETDGIGDSAETDAADSVDSADRVEDSADGVG